MSVTANPTFKVGLAAPRTLSNTARVLCHFDAQRQHPAISLAQPTTLLGSDLKSRLDGKAAMDTASTDRWASSTVCRSTALWRKGLHAFREESSRSSSAFIGNHGRPSATRCRHLSAQAHSVNSRQPHLPPIRTPAKHAPGSYITWNAFRVLQGAGEPHSQFGHPTMLVFPNLARGSPNR
ncbi:hypothetical protein RhiLY_08949 [Ceratobasidium sp. AG-Ba]|nr:hypothetical protein RhiLY_08949 [Ceratobasidium sp. AG-Ba]